MLVNQSSTPHNEVEVIASTNVIPDEVAGARLSGIVGELCKGEREPGSIRLLRLLRHKADGDSESDSDGREEGKGKIGMIGSGVRAAMPVYSILA